MTVSNRIRVVQDADLNAAVQFLLAEAASDDRRFALIHEHLGELREQVVDLQEEVRELARGSKELTEALRRRRRDDDPSKPSLVPWGSKP